MASVTSAGITGLLAVAGIVVAAVIGFPLIYASRRYPTVRTCILFLALGLFAWFQFGQPIGGDLVADLLCLAGAIALGGMLWRRYGWHPLEKARVLFAVGLSFWASASLVEEVRQRPLPVASWTATAPASAVLPNIDELRVGVALSGGGYRAAVFHAGTLQGLINLGIRPSTLSTVSGGSIIGAYFWRGGDPAAFRDAVVAGQFNLLRELMLIQNAARLVFPIPIHGTPVELFPWYRFDRLDVQVEMLETLVVDGEPFAPATDGRPNLIINATDLNQALHVAALPDGVMVLPPNPNQYPQARQPDGFFVGKDNWTMTPSLSLAELVATSGAFPGAFPTTAVELQVNDRNRAGWRPLSLSDGGVIDNVGTTALLRANASFDAGDAALDASWRSDVIVISDAGALFAARRQTTGVAAAARAFDVSHTHVLAGAGQRPEAWVRRWISVTPKSSIRHLALPSPDGGEIVPEPRIAVWIQPIAVPAPLLERIVQLLPTAQQTSARAALAAYLAEDPYERFYAADPRSQRLFPKYQARLGKDDCLDTLQADGHEVTPLWQAACASADLRLAIRTGLAEYVEVFGTIPTLKSQLNRDEADALFNLGEALTYIRHYRLEQAVTLVTEQGRTAARDNPNY